MSSNDENIRLRAKCIKLVNEKEKYRKEICQLKARIEELEASIESIKNAAISFKQFKLI